MLHGCLASVILTTVLALNLQPPKLEVFTSRAPAMEATRITAGLQPRILRGSDTLGCTDNTRVGW